MNNARRKAIKTMINRLDDKLLALVEELKEDIQMILDEEEEAYDNLPDGLKESENGEKMQEAIENLQSAVDYLEGFDIEEITSYLEDAMQ